MRILELKAHAVLVDKLQSSQTSSVCYTQISFISETGARTHCQFRGSVGVVETGTSQRKVDNVKSRLNPTLLLFHNSRGLTDQNTHTTCPFSTA